MSGEEEKKVRTTAKKKFTRCYNRLNEYILSKEGKNIIISKYEDLKLLWNEVQAAHDNYLFAKYPEEEQEISNKEDEWLNDIEEKYEIIGRLKCEYLQTIESKEQNENTLKIEQKVTEQLDANNLTISKNRTTAKALLIQDIKGVEELIKMDKNKLMKLQVLAGMKDVKCQLEKCKESHMLYMTNLSTEEGSAENKWIEEVYRLYECLNRKIYEYVESVSEHELRDKKNIDLKMERLKMPSFNGNIRNYAKFKSDFKNQVEVQVKSDSSLSYILKSCLSGDALAAVENIDESKDIWERLDKKYGQPSLVIDIIMNEIKEAHLVTDNDS